MRSTAWVRNRNVGYSLVHQLQHVCLLNIWFLNSSKKKKRGARAVGNDKGGRGLRQFSMKGNLGIELLPFFCFYVFLCLLFISFFSIRLGFAPQGFVVDFPPLIYLGRVCVGHACALGD